MTPATHLRPQTLHLGPFPRAQLPGLVQAVVNQPVHTVTRPLLISTALNPGATVAVAAGDLPTSPSHDALFILQGPTSRAQRLVAVRHGVAVGVVTLPASLPRGTSILAAEDFSRLRVSGQARPTGIVLLDIAVFSVR